MQTNHGSGVCLLHTARVVLLCAYCVVAVYSRAVLTRSPGSQEAKGKALHWVSVQTVCKTHFVELSNEPDLQTFSKNKTGLWAGDLL